MSEAGKLHDVQECQMRRLRQIHDIKGRLVEMPRVIALSLVGLDADAIERLLSAQIQTILDELAGGDAGATPEAPP
jgi:tRNA U54 and U55 pseudouridine synthase Pus10